MRLDVFARPRHRVALSVRDAAVDDAAQPCEGRRHDCRELLGEGPQQLSEVGAGRGPPVSCHVGLTYPDLRVVGESFEERLRADYLEHRPVR